MFWPRARKTQNHPGLVRAKIGDYGVAVLDARVVVNTFEPSAVVNIKARGIGHKLIDPLLVKPVWWIGYPYGADATAHLYWLTTVLFAHLQG
jgi:hypothetical protein